MGDAQTRPSAIWLLVMEEFSAVPEWCQHAKCSEIKSRWQQDTYCVPQDTYCVPHTILSGSELPPKRKTCFAHLSHHHPVW